MEFNVLKGLLFMGKPTCPNSVRGFYSIPGTDRVGLFRNVFDKNMTHVWEKDQNQFLQRFYFFCCVINVQFVFMKYKEILFPSTAKNLKSISLKNMRFMMIYVTESRRSATTVSWVLNYGCLYIYYTPEMIRHISNYDKLFCIPYVCQSNNYQFLNTYATQCRSSNLSPRRQLLCGSF